MLGVASAFKFRTPLGTGATTFANINGMAEGILKSDQYAITMLEPFLFSLIPMVMVGLYCVFAWRLMPKHTNINQAAVKDTVKESTMTPTQEKIVYVVFSVTMLIMILNKWTGNLMYLAPAMGVLVLIWCKVLPVKDAVNSMTGDMIWMLAGVLVVSNALGASGAGDLIGNVLLSMIGENPSSFGTMLLFSAVTVIMTNLMSNMGTQTVLIPIAASVALAGGWDPRGLLLIAGVANMSDVAMPSGSGEAAVAFAAGGYNPFDPKVLRFTVPYMLVTILAYAISAHLMFPLYG